MTQSSGWPTTGEDRAPHGAAAVAQLDDVADDLTVLAALHRRRAAGVQPRRPSPG